MSTMTPPISPRKNLHHFLHLLSILSILQFAISDELETLLTIKTSFQNSNTNVFNDWLSTNHLCNFTGITCNSINSVKEIDLSNQNLTGTIPLKSICELKTLEKLSLGKNSLHGQVTEFLNKCSNLNYLDLGNNFFSGSIPEISALSKLTYLHMNNSGFSGVFPWNSLKNMTNLRVLSLGDNPFDRTPFPRVIVELKNINWLYLSNSSIEGKIPEEIGNLTELMSLELATNFISGEIPHTITNLKKLWRLELYENTLSGTFPEGFGNLTNLEYLDASTNFLHGDLSEIRFLNNLVSLQLLENSFSGEVPEELGEFKKLVNLSLYRNKLSGELPKNLGSWGEFIFIDVSENRLTGPISPDMCKRGTMTELLLLQNNFTGPIPESYVDCKTLTRIRVSNNSLSGVFPSGIWGLPEIEMIDIELNLIEGVITSDIGNAKSLNSLILGHNRLTGNIPTEISKAKNLALIDLSDNRFSGEIPDSIGELKELYSLHIETNKFTGSIPDSLGACDSMNDINMAENLLVGEIPASFGGLPRLNFLNLSSNQLSGEIPKSLSSLKLNLLDLSDNRLFGPIPVGLSMVANNGSFSGNNGLCSGNLKEFRECSPESGKSGDTKILIICIIVGAMVIIGSLVGLCILYSKKTRGGCKKDLWSMRSFHVLTFNEEEILDAIKHENMIGKGGSGSVYKVELNNEVKLAVKHILHTVNDEAKNETTASPIIPKVVEKSKEFDAEVETLSSIRHINVVKLYCSITSEDSSMLVYEYLPNGSLWDRLHTCKKMVLDWDTRYEIAIGSAKGLEYLHHGCERPVLHRDVKSSNILLDEFFKPKIADFGLAKSIQSGLSKDSTHIVAGTLGYIAPEYGYTYKVNEKSDVYSFGVVLMELVTGKRPIEPEYGSNKDIVEWVCGKLKTKESVISLVDANIGQPYKEDAVKVLRIAILCTAKLPALRPTMRSVVQMLEEAVPCKLVSIVVDKDGDKN